MTGEAEFARRLHRGVSRQGGVWKSVEEDLLTAPEDPSIRYTLTSARAQPREAATSTPASCRPSVSPIPSRERCRSAAAPWDVTPAREARRTSRRAVRRAYCRRSDSRAPMSRTSARRSRATRRRCSASATRSPITAIRRGCSKRSPGTRGITSMSKGTSRVRRISGSIWKPSFSTPDAIDIGGYDYAFIQDQSQNPATYGRDGTTSIAANCTALANKIRAKSASCKVILEQTWTFSASSYGGFTDFATFENYNAQGAHAMAEAAGTWVSPIGVAFRIVREGSSGINLYHTDNKHQSVYGAYLKACVNYLVLYGEAFGSSPADCGIEASKAAYLRSVAEQVVLGHENEYLIQR